MSLNNSQYDEIMRSYDAKQLRNRRILADRTASVSLQAPRLADIDHEISSAGITAARRRLAGDSLASASLHQTLRQLREERSRLLVSLGYPEDYLDPDSICDCPDCHDTGYIGGEKCHCFRQAIIDSVYTQSSLRQVLEKENFDHFSLDCYSETAVSKTTGLTSRETARRAEIFCRKYAADFSKGPRNVLFYGDTGTGKTFLSNCIAREVLDSGNSVLYFSAFGMFDLLGRQTFDRDSDAMETHQNIFDCDLLILDDLGTELTNSFTASQLFLIVNERILRGRSTIISTNLNMSQILEKYSERTFSRITSNYTVIKLFGDDIRLKRRNFT